MLFMLFGLATSRKSTMFEKYCLLFTRNPLYFSLLFTTFHILFEFFRNFSKRNSAFFCFFSAFSCFFLLVQVNLLFQGGLLFLAVFQAQKKVEGIAFFYFSCFFAEKYGKHRKAWKSK